MTGRILLIVSWLMFAPLCYPATSQGLSELKRDETLGTLRVANLFADSYGKIVGAKFRDIRTGAPVYLLQIETVPQAFMWAFTAMSMMLRTG
jgi:hypothetical protein